MIAISRWLWVVVSLLVGVVRCKVEDGDPYASYAESYADAYADYYGNDEEAAVATAAVPRIATESYLLLSMDAHGCQRRRYTGAASGEKGLRTDLQRMEDAKRQAEMRMRGMSEADMALEGLGGAGGAVVDAGEGYGYDDDDGGYYYGDEDGGYGYGYAGEEEEEAGEGLLDTRRFVELLVKDLPPASDKEYGRRYGVSDRTVWREVLRLGGLADADVARQRVVAHGLGLEFDELERAYVALQRRMSGKFLPSEQQALQQRRAASRRRVKARARDREYRYGPDCEAIVCHACRTVATAVLKAPVGSEAAVCGSHGDASASFAFGPLQRMCRALTESVHSATYLQVIASERNGGGGGGARNEHRVGTELCIGLGACGMATGASAHQDQGQGQGGVAAATVVAATVAESVAAVRPWTPEWEAAVSGGRATPEAGFVATVAPGYQEGGLRCARCLTLGNELESRFYFLGAAMAAQAGDVSVGAGWANELDEDSAEALVAATCHDLGFPVPALLGRAISKVSWFVSQHFERYYQADTTDRSAPKPFAEAMCELADACSDPPPNAAHDRRTRTFS